MIAILAAAAVAAGAAVPAASPDDTVAQVRALYQQSCQVRAYGSYDDLCNGLKAQLKQAEQDARKARSQAAKTAAADKPAKIQPIDAPAPPAPASSEPAQ